MQAYQALVAGGSEAMVASSYADQPRIAEGYTTGGYASQVRDCIC